MILIFFQLYKVLNIFPILKIILKTLGEDVPFKLRSDRQYLDDDFRCADLGVDVVGTNQQSYFIPLKILQQPHQVGGFSADAVQLVTGHFPRLNVPQESLKIWPVGVIATQTFVLIPEKLIVLRQR